MANPPQLSPRYFVREDLTRLGMSLAVILVVFVGLILLDKRIGFIRFVPDITEQKVNEQQPAPELEANTPTQSPSAAP